MWDVTGEKLDVLLAPSEDEMMAVQAAARQLGLPTHTFAGGCCGAGAACDSMLRSALNSFHTNLCE